MGAFRQAESNGCPYSWLLSSATCGWLTFSRGQWSVSCSFCYRAWRPTI